MNVALLSCDSRCISLRGAAENGDMREPVGKGHKARGVCRGIEAKGSMNCDGGSAILCSFRAVRVDNLIWI